MENSPVNSQASTTSASGRRESFNETMSFYEESTDPQTFEIEYFIIFSNHKKILFLS